MPVQRELVVGRAAELDELRADFEAALAGQGRLVLLSGAAGIGKTALAQRLVAHASAVKVPVVRSRCVDDEGAPPLWPWTQALTRVGAGAPGHAAVDAGPGGGPDGSGTGADSAAARFLRLDRLAGQLCRAAGPAGLIVVLEDLQWADEASLQMLRHLAGELAGTRLLLVVTARVPTPPPVAAALHDAMRQPDCRTVELGPLTATAVNEYLTLCTGRATHPALVREVHGRTGGSPLLLRAVIPVLDVAQVSSQAGSASQPLSPDVWGRVAQAADVGRLASGMLAQLSAEHRAPIDIAAVLGETVDPEVLTEVSGSDQVQAALRAALRVGLLRSEGIRAAEGGTGYRFSHALVRDALVAELDPERRRDVHLQIGRRLATRAATDPSYLEPGPPTWPGPGHRRWLAGSWPLPRLRQPGRLTAGWVSRMPPGGGRSPWMRSAGPVARTRTWPTRSSSWPPPSTGPVTSATASPAAGPRPAWPPSSVGPICWVAARW